MTDQDIEGMKRNIEAQLDEFEQAIADAQAWYVNWHKNRSAFRCVRAGRKLDIDQPQASP